MGARLKAIRVTHPAESRLLEHFQGREFVYTSEAASILGVEGVEYRQLRLLLALVRNVEDGKDLGSRWAQFTLSDLAALSIAIDLVGGVAALRPGGRMRLDPLRKACAALRALGVKNPLVDVPLAVHGRRIVARIEGLLVDPANGQAILGSVYDLMVERTPSGATGASARQRLMSEMVSSRDFPRTIGQRGIEVDALALEAGASLDR